MEVTLAIAIIGCVISVSSFALNRKDKSNKDTQNDSYKWGMIDTQIKQILNKLDKIDSKLDNYDKEIDERINIALEHHIKEYHERVWLHDIKRGSVGIGKRSKRNTRRKFSNVFIKGL